MKNKIDWKTKNKFKIQHCWVSKPCYQAYAKFDFPSYFTMFENWNPDDLGFMSWVWVDLINR
jgi:hypothetical protein